MIRSYLFQTYLSEISINAGWIRLIPCWVWSWIKIRIQIISIKIIKNATPIFVSWRWRRKIFQFFQLRNFFFGFFQTFLSEYWGFQTWSFRFLWCWWFRNVFLQNFFAGINFILVIVNEARKIWPRAWPWKGHQRCASLKRRYGPTRSGSTLSFFNLFWNLRRCRKLEFYLGCRKWGLGWWIFLWRISDTTVSSRCIQFHSFFRFWNF